MHDLNENFLEWNYQGIIPGPEESEEAFVKRALYCQQLRNNFPDMIPGEMESLKKEDQAFALSQKFFDIKPTWIPLFFSNYQLRFWQGGCAWIFQQSDNSPTSAFFQLRRNFRDSKKYLGLYDRDEIIAHELAHVGRMVFQEPKYEELLAYQTAKSSFRRWFGPIIQSSVESMIFVLLLFFTCAFDLWALFTGDPAVFHLASWFKIFPMAAFLFGLYGLYRKHRTFSQAKQNLNEIIFEETKVNAMLYRMTDKEIDAFSEMDSEAIKTFIHNQQELRWRLISQVYFNH